MPRNEPRARIASGRKARHLSAVSSPGGRSTAYAAAARLADPTGRRPVRLEGDSVKHGGSTPILGERRRPPRRRTAAAIPRAQPEGSASGQTIAAGGVGIRLVRAGAAPNTLDRSVLSPSQDRGPCSARLPITRHCRPILWAGPALRYCLMRVAAEIACPRRSAAANRLAARPRNRPPRPKVITPRWRAHGPDDETQMKSPGGWIGAAQVHTGPASQSPSRGLAEERGWAAPSPVRPLHRTVAITRATTVSVEPQGSTPRRERGPKPPPPPRRRDRAP